VQQNPPLERFFKLVFAGWHTDIRLVLDAGWSATQMFILPASSGPRIEMLGNPAFWPDSRSNSRALGKTVHRPPEDLSVQRESVNNGASRTAPFCYSSACDQSLALSRHAPETGYLSL